jgi:hypothetical protein
MGAQHVLLLLLLPPSSVVTSWLDVQSRSTRCMCCTYHNHAGTLPGSTLLLLLLLFLLLLLLLLLPG